MLDTIAWYTPFFITVSLIFVAWRYSDWKTWRNWRKYYPTILFISVFSLLAYILTIDYPLWLYNETFLFHNRMMHELRLIFFLFPSIILLFLTFYPKTSVMLRQLVYIFIWVIIWSIVETFLVFLKIITYHNGWNFPWSVVVWFIMFSVIAIHQKKPIWVWLICMIFSAIVIIYFNIPLVK
ncbi:CBO0543 family protein [Paenisporosarcina sp. TG-14]|uniref:CBO0543 family protein n=1 Tax=Paenisporosarcina sp. TG-14 TaxID=1231057 RepID=UPI0002E5D1A2|nr:CBO0543 family protein [Paenisporosarcina sp. TG-14]